FEFYDDARLLVFGNTEMAYLNSIDDRRDVIDSLFAHGTPAVILCREHKPCAEMTELARHHCIPMLSTKEATSNVISALVAYLNVELAQRITRHGVLVEVYGEGVMLTGDSGVGKSETAIELIKRGHRLIADDAVEIRRVSSKTLVGSAPANIRHFVELRGVGIIDARRIFGMGAIKLTEKIDMIVNLETWNPEKPYDRLGMAEEYTDILGINVNTVTIPIKPGRNLAIIIEVAAMNNRQKKMGFNAAQELLQNLGLVMNT
ncbi:MAG: HPr(Ser) kinase/phosphatase, partial [Oscillospiraceae bacterium]|nr:HPr(Ser) kinase/phosphatase [Oscillospiraceae bacterium]